MARNRVILETITCDVCGKQIESPITRRLAVNKDAWNLDLCDDDARIVDQQIESWVANAQRADNESPRRSPARQSKDDWEFLETLGFKRHRGRKTPAETAALANRR